MASRRWKVTLFVLATSLGLSTSSTGTQRLGKKSLCAPEQGMVYYVTEVCVPSASIMEVVAWSPGCPGGCALPDPGPRCSRQAWGTFRLVAVL